MTGGNDLAVTMHDGTISSNHDWKIKVCLILNLVLRSVNEEEAPAVKSLETGNVYTVYRIQ